MNQLPDWVSITIGTLIVSNIGTIISVLFAGGRLVWWASKVDTQLTHVSNVSNRAHRRIDQIQNQKECS